MVREEGLPDNQVLPVGMRPKNPRGQGADAYEADRESSGWEKAGRWLVHRSFVFNCLPGSSEKGAGPDRNSCARAVCSGMIGLLSGAVVVCRGDPR